MTNTGYLFYKHYFRPEGERIFDPRKFPKKSNEDKKVKEANKNLFSSKNEKLLELTYSAAFRALMLPETVRGIQSNIVLQTTYPGLVLGTGYTHETGGEGEFKLGFFFDYTTGLPVIPGSSWKGVCRSMFPKFAKTDEAHKGEKVILLCYWLKEITGNTFFDCDQISTAHYDERLKKQISAQAAFIHKLELNIFEGIRPSDSQPDSMYRHDVFHDSFISSGGQGGKILADDYITPHINREHPQLSPFTNPTPIQFLKVLPGVQFTFQCAFKEILIDGITISREQKEDLCRKILLFKGTGAKTNVGYGQWSEQSGYTAATGPATPGAAANNAGTTPKKPASEKQTDLRQLPFPPTPPSI